MRRIFLLGAAVVLVFWSLSRFSTRTEASTSGTPVLVELFTSEGCSSCPPADRLLADLARTQPLAGAEIIVLSEHVDYWNRLGWTDPFSSADFSRRQSDYAGVFNSRGIYTPQMVVDGRFEFVGSDAREAHKTISAAAQKPKAGLVAVLSLAGAEGSVSLKASLPAIPQEVAGPVDVWLALAEDELETNVLRGENSGKRLKHTAVVRQLRKLGEIKPKQPGPFEWSREVELDPAWKTSNLRAVVFLQERRSRRIVGVAAAGL